MLECKLGTAVVTPAGALALSNLFYPENIILLGEVSAIQPRKSH